MHRTPIVIDPDALRSGGALASRRAWRGRQTELRVEVVRTPRGRSYTIREWRRVRDPYRPRAHVWVRGRTLIRPMIGADLRVLLTLLEAACAAIPRRRAR
jgi:hypothetical protein